MANGDDMNVHGTEDLRGSTPVLSAKQVLEELRLDMKDVLKAIAALEQADIPRRLREMQSEIAILHEASLPDRMDAVERWQSRWIGVATAVGMIGVALMGLVLGHTVFPT
jgi:hypothetical protein